VANRRGASPWVANQRDASLRDDLALRHCSHSFIFPEIRYDTATAGGHFLARVEKRNSGQSTGAVGPSVFGVMPRVCRPLRVMPRTLPAQQLPPRFFAARIVGTRLKGPDEQTLKRFSPELAAFTNSVLR
jgi:hypothetical protein